MRVRLATYSAARENVTAYYNEKYPNFPAFQGYNLWHWIGQLDPPKVKYDITLREHTWDVSEDAARVAKMLASPHYRTILKAAEITKPDWYQHLNTYYFRRC